MVLDLLDLLGDGLLVAFVRDARQVLYVILGATVAAALLFVLCSWFTRQWNRAAARTMGHYVWCGLAAVMTIMLSLGAVATLRLEEVARSAVNTWSASFDRGSENYMRTWRVSRKALADSGIDQPDDPQIAHFGDDLEKGLMISAEATVAEAIRIFEEENRLLYSLISTDLKPVTRRLVEDARADFEAMRQWARKAREENPLALIPKEKRTREFTKDIAILQDEMDHAFAKALPVFQQRALWIYGLIFVVVQTIPFVLSGLSAYRQIRIDPKRPRLSSGPSYSTTRKRPSNRYRR